MDLYPFEHVYHLAGGAWLLAMGATVIAAWLWPAYHAWRRDALNFQAIAALSIAALLAPPLWLVALLWACRGEYRGAAAGGAFPVLNVAEKP